jgi:tetratricopeptide (TPR) repeat protein
MVGCVRSGKQGTTNRQQSSTYRELLPAELEPTPTATTEPLVVKVRAYADKAHRAQTLQWERRLSVRLKAANKVLAPSAGIVLQLVETMPWERGTGDDMAEMLRQLETLDPATDVDIVIGMVDALAHVSSQIHQLGVARPLGRHVILRGLNDAKEVQLLEAALDTVDDKAREELYAARKRHKEIVLLLHELAHTFGAMHVADREKLLHPAYDARQKGLSPYTAKLMRTVAEKRYAVGNARDERASLEALSAYLESTTWAGWVSSERKELEQLLSTKLAKPGTGAAAATLSEAVRPVDREAYQAASRLAENEKWHEAWERLEALLEFYPDEPGVQLLACRLMMKRGGGAGTMAQCERASKLTPNDPEPDLLIARAHIKAKKVKLAMASLERARKRLSALPGDARRQWALLAVTYKELGSVTLAAEAAKQGKGPADVAEWAAHTGARYAVPPNGSKFGIEPAGEDDYISEVKSLLKLVYAKKFKEAETALRVAERRYKGAPGLLVVRCDMEIRRRRYPQARKFCSRALKTFEGAAWGHYLTGLLDKRDKKEASATKHLARAIELYPDLRHAYQVLAGLHEAASRTEELTNLRDAYHKRFGYPLRK